MIHTIVPLLWNDAMAEYSRWVRERRIVVAAPKAGFMHVAETPEGVLPLCSVSLFQCDGPMVFCEHFVTNPNLDARGRRAVVEGFPALSTAIRAYCCAVGKAPWALVSRRSVAVLLFRAGWRQQPAGHWTAPSTIPAGDDDRGTRRDRLAVEPEKRPSPEMELDPSDFDVVT